MAEKETLVRAIHRIATDEEFRRRLMVTPREVLMAELGISREAYDALVGLAPVLLAGGLFLFGGKGIPGPDGMAQPQWGGWGRK
jgi:hypothetical protein